MTNTKKMPKAQMFAQIKAKYDLTADEIAFIDHEIELLAKKNANKSSKPTAKQIANEELKDVIFMHLAETERAYTIADMIKSIPECDGLSTSKVSALVRMLINENKVERFEEKRKAYFKVAD